jgi:hypothetical protein
MIRIGVRSFVSAGGGTDADAQAFITAAGITDATQQSAINTLVTDLKGYSIWDKMKAIYPFVGGTSSTHKWNLKDARDLDAAFRLVFSGGWTHSSTGALPNGTNAYANTNLTPSISLNQDSVSLSFYSRTGYIGAGGVDMGAINSTNINKQIQLISRFSNVNYDALNNLAPNNNNANYATTAFFQTTRTSSTTYKSFRNSSVIFTNTITTNGDVDRSIWIGARNNDGQYGNRQCAFASIGDGLTDTEAANFYTAVQAYQTTLGRSVGTQTVSDADAQAFVNAAVIEDQVQATAINTLVTDLKGYGIWTKMKAIYPFVGGTSSTHKWNLKDPRDLDAAFRLVFNGGWTHSSNGATPNGTNAYSDTKLNASTLTASDSHVSFYSRTNSEGTYFDIGASSSNSLQLISIYGRLSGNAIGDIGLYTTSRISVSVANSQGFYNVKRTATNNLKLFKNGVEIGSNTSNDTTSLPNRTISLSAVITSGATYQQFSDRECAFASIGDGLTDTEAANFYTAVQAYQTTLSRNV